MAEAPGNTDPSPMLGSVQHSFSSTASSTIHARGQGAASLPAAMANLDLRERPVDQSFSSTDTMVLDITPPLSTSSRMSENYQVAASEDTMLPLAFRTPLTSWDRQEKTELLDKLRKKKPPHGIPNYNILTLGSIGVGKTTFSNTLLSVPSGKHNTSQHTADSDKSVTTEVQMVQLSSDTQLPIYTYDVRGYEVANDRNPDPFPPHKTDIEHLLNGEIKHGYELQRDCIRHDDKHYDPAGCEDRKIHAVVLMTDIKKITSADFETMGLTPYYEEVLKNVRKKKIQVVAMVNKVDGIPAVDADLKKVFYCEKLQDARDELSSMFGVSPDDVLFQKNCVDQSSLTPELSCLTLSNLLHILDKADLTISIQTGKPILPPSDLLPTPWRPDIGVTPKHKTDACTYLKNLEVPLNIVLMGPRSAGKTQFINSAQAAIKDKTLVLTLDTGRRDRPVTTKLQHFKLADDVKVTLIDTTSLSPDKQKGMHEDDVKATLEGRVPDEYGYNCLESCRSTERQYPVHVAVFVINGKTFRENQAEVEEVKRAIQVAKQTEPKKLVAVLVTHVADLQPGIDAANVYHCQEVKHCIDEVFESLAECDIQNIDILPICNYTSKDSGLTDAKSAIILQSLKHLCERAESLLPPPPPAPASPSKPKGWINWLTGK